MQAGVLTRVRTPALPGRPRRQPIRPYERLPEGPARSIVAI
jgi:hypothetical protein